MDQFISDYPALFFALVVLCPIIFWVLICLAIQKFGPWSILTKKYPFNKEFGGNWLNWQFMTIDKTFCGGYFGGYVSMGFGKDFVYLRFCPKFNYLFNKPIQIPWSAIQSISEKKFLWFCYYNFTIEGAPNLMICRSKALNNYLAQNAGQSKVLLEFNTRQKNG